MNPQISRRNLLKGLGGFALVLALPACQRPTPPMRTPALPAGPGRDMALTAFLEFRGDGQLVLVMPSCEMGQGAQTGLAQILAEELDANWDEVSVVMAQRGDEYKNPGMGAMLTGGSNSVEGWWDALRQAGAVGRALMLAAAAKRWGVDASQCQVKQGVVLHKERQASYAELVVEAAALPLPTDVVLKSVENFHTIGQSKPRLELASKCNGTATFGIDVVRPGMVQAAVTNAPVFGAKLTGMNEEAALAKPGVIKVVEVSGGVAVVADTYWRARQGLAALEPTFKGEQSLNSESLAAQFQKDLGKKGGGEHLVGEPESAFEKAAFQLEREYSVPFLAHAPMEPMNCTAEVTSEKAILWVPTQVQDSVAKAVMDVTGLPLDKVEINTTFLGGGFGRRLESDYATQATEIAKAVGKPVKMIWSREETTQHGFYRPASLTRFRVGLDPQGVPISWINRLVGPAKRMKPDGDDSVLTRGAREPHYDIPHFRFDYVNSEAPVPVGYWRSVSHSHTGFYVESLLDEIALETEADPVELRRKLLKGRPRHLAVLNAVAESAKWGNPPKGRFQGLALHESFGSIVGQVVEVSLQGKSLKVHDVYCAVDCGIAVNPELIATQMEGGVVFALTAAFFGKITLEEGRVKESNFHNYKMTLMRQAPTVHSQIVPSKEKPGGIGEPTVPPFAPALAAAIVAAGGPRIRSLPMKDHGLKLV